MPLRFTSEALRVLKDLESPNFATKLKKVRKALGLLGRVSLCVKPEGDRA